MEWNFEITFSWLYPSMKTQVQVRPIKLLVMLIIDLKLQSEKHWPRRDSNPQSSDPKSDAISIRPRGRREIFSKSNSYKNHHFNMDQILGHVTDDSFKWII